MNEKGSGEGRCLAVHCQIAANVLSKNYPKVGEWILFIFIHSQIY